MNRSLISLRALVLSALLLLVARRASAADAVPARILHVLFIGNSYTYGNDLPGLIAQLLPVRGIKLEHESVTPGGATLEKQWTDGKALQAIQKQKWDYIVLQEQSTRPFAKREAMFDAARHFQAEIAKAGAKTLLYETWAAQASPDEQPKLTDAYETLGRELGAAVVPVGEAWKKAIAAGFELHGPDHRHPNRAGSYLAACLFVRALTGENPAGLPEDGTTEGKPWKVERAPVLQRIAGETPLPSQQSAAEETFSLHEFAGDLWVPDGTDGPYRGIGTFSYVTPDGLPEIAQLAILKPGITREALSKVFNENGGLTSNEFFVREVSIKGRLVCARLFFRPAAMPEAIYPDSKLRQAWLIEHKPKPGPADVLMRFTRPFLSHSIID